jgi:hypothetical protein
LQLCFGTEHLYMRHDDQWLKNCRVRHYLLPVHLSEAFLFTPTLGSTCYLLLLRWINRQFGDVFRLAESCVSDKRLEPGKWRAFDSAANPSLSLSLKGALAL